jgi:hypothetical protein
LEKFPSGASSLENAKMTINCFDLNNSRMPEISPYTVALLAVAAEEWRLTCRSEFNGNLCTNGQRQVFKVYHDLDFWLVDEDISDEAFAARHWVRIHIFDPQYGVSMLMVWVDLKTGRLNIDGELARYPVAADAALRIEKYLEEVLVPAIQERIPIGKNPDDFPGEECFPA